MQVMLGEHNLRVFEGTEQLMKTDTIIWHPEWVENLTTRTSLLHSAWLNDPFYAFLSVCSYDYQTLDFDIMLIKLYHPVEVTDAVAPIPLPTTCPVAGVPCSVSGWGNTAQDGDGSFLIVILIIKNNLTDK